MSKRGSRFVYLVGVLWFHSLVAGGNLHAQGVSFVARRDFAAGTNPFSVAVGDFNGDGKPDLAVANFNSNNVSVLLGNGDGTFQAAVNFGAGSGPAPSPWATSMAMGFKIWQWPTLVPITSRCCWAMGMGASRRW